jgi:hypothetical protein
MKAAGPWPPRARWKLARGGARLSIEAGPRARGASSPRARRSPAGGGVRPSSETEPHSRGRPTHERGGVVPGRRRTPRAKRSSARGLLGWLFDGPWVRGFVLRVCLGSFAFIFYEFKRVSPGSLGDPHGYPRHMSIRIFFSWIIKTIYLKKLLANTTNYILHLCIYKITKREMTSFNKHLFCVLLLSIRDCCYFH